MPRVLGRLWIHQDNNSAKGSLAEVTFDPSVCATGNWQVKFDRISTLRERRAAFLPLHGPKAERTSKLGWQFQTSKLKRRERRAPPSRGSCRLISCAEPLIFET
jgi:hypothetical protein